MFWTVWWTCDVKLTLHVHQTVLNNLAIIAFNNNYNQLCFLESLLIKIELYKPQLNYDIKAAKEFVSFCRGVATCTGRYARAYLKKRAKKWMEYLFQKSTLLASFWCILSKIMDCFFPTPECPFPEKWRDTFDKRILNHMFREKAAK